MSANGNAMDYESSMPDFKKPTTSELREKLSPEQFAVTQQCGTGWPSFTKPLDAKNVTYHKEQDLWARIEVRSLNADSHLGHVFPDGPHEAGGQRFCMNSASLRFVALDDLEKEGYGQYLSLFQKK